MTDLAMNVMITSLKTGEGTDFPINSFCKSSSSTPLVSSPLFQSPCGEGRDQCLIGMNRNREMDGTSLFYQDMVAPLNMVHDPSCPFEGGDMPISPRPGEFRHN